MTHQNDRRSRLWTFAGVRTTLGGDRVPTMPMVVVGSGERRTDLFSVTAERKCRPLSTVSTHAEAGWVRHREVSRPPGHGRVRARWVRGRYEVDGTSRLLRRGPAWRRPNRARPLWSAWPRAARPGTTRRPAPIVRRHRTAAPVVVCALPGRWDSRAPTAAGGRPRVSAARMRDRLVHGRRRDADPR